MIRRLRLRDTSSLASSILNEHDMEQEGLSQEEIDFQRMLDNAARHVEQMEQMEQQQEASITTEEQRIAESPLPAGAVPIDTAVDAQPIPPYEDGELERVDILQIRDAESVEEVKKVLKKKPIAPKAISESDRFKETILRIAIGYLGEDNVSLEKMSIPTISERRDVLLLVWPFIEMTNRRGDRHDIKDMIVGMPLNNRGTGFDSALHGGRFTVTHVENFSGYRHSHLYRMTEGIQPFCTGSDGINDLWSSLILDGHNSNDFEIRLEGFLHQMYSFLAYESLEGVPYFRMREIGYRNRNYYNGSDQARDVRRMANALVPNDFTLSFDFNAAKVRVVHTEHIHSIMAEAANTHQYRMHDGTFVDDPNTNNSGRPRSFEGGYTDGEGIPWKGEIRRTYIEPITNNGEQEEQQRQSSRKRYAHNRAVNQLFDAVEKEGRQRVEALCLENYVQERDEKEGPANYRKRFDGRNNLSPCETTESRVVRTTLLEDERGSGSGEAGDNSN